MNPIEDLGLTVAEAAILQDLGVEQIEEVTGEVLAKVTGRMRNRIAAKLEQWKRKQDPDDPDETEEVIEPLWHGRSFGERLANLREGRGYIRKVMKHGMNYTAVQFEDLLEAVRPLFIQWGISWHTEATQIVESRAHQRGELLILEDLIVFTFRFQCVEGQTHDQPGIGGNWYRDIQVPARSFDVYDPGSDYPQGDKGPGKAHTYGQKMALRTILNLPAGDDPDFTPAASLSTRARAERDELVARLRKALLASGITSDEAVNKQIQELIETLNERHHRAVAAIEDTPDQILLGWCEHYEEKVDAKASQS